MKGERKIICIAILLGIAIWIIDAITDSLYFGGGRFWDALVMKLPNHEVYGRSISFAIVLISGFLLAKAMANQKAIEYELAKANEELENKVAQRTNMLHQANQQLQVELDEHRKMEEALQESEKRVRNVSFELLAAKERERREISRELHDEFGQTLALLKQNLWRVEKRAVEKESELAKDVRESLQKVDEIIENVRRISSNLSPHILEYGGLSTALGKLIKDFSKHHSINVTGELNNMDHKIPKESHIVLYRIFQEALNNIGKHASANRVSVCMKDDGNNISFLIEDDGRGFDVNRTILGNAGEKGFGLAILDERVKMLGGRLALWSQEGKGTRVSFSIPISPTRTD